MIAILSLAVFALLIAFLEKQSRDHCLDGLKYDVRTDRRCVECGETFRMNTTVTNDKRLPVLFLKLAEYIPAELRIDPAQRGRLFRSESLFQSENTTLHQSMYILGYQKVKRSLEVSLEKRGRYLLRGARLTAGDLLGLKEETEQVDLIREIVVKPEREDIHEIERAFGGYLGDISVMRFINPDPIQTIGFREYTGREPQRDISWKQTLRMNRLMVKQYDYTAEERSSVLVDISGGTAEEIEACFRIARGVCEYLEDHRIVYGFYTNAVRVASDFAESYIPDGIGNVHLETVLEQMGRADHMTVCPTAKLLEQTIINHSDTRSYVMITPHPEKKQKDLHRHEQLIGRKIFTIDASMYAHSEVQDDHTD